MFRPRSRAYIPPPAGASQPRTWAAIAALAAITVGRWRDRGV
jgi:hypothetical protein